jgi:P-type Ca2+ transporter type 2C
MTAHNDIKGLTSEEAESRLRKEGYNEIPSKDKSNAWRTLVHVFSEPMLLLLVGAGTIYLFLGEMKDALVLIASVFIIIGITFYQERKTERTLEALKDLSSPRALVIRDGIHKRVPGREVARGDVIMLLEGDRVPADAIVLSCENFSVDESLLTGESVPVRKRPQENENEAGRPGGDDLPFIYSSTLVVSGRAEALVQKTGAATEIGKIGKSLESITDEETLLRKETARIVRIVAIIAVVLCLVVVFAYTFIKGDLIQGLLSGLTLSMALLPEEFPVVLVIFLTLGAWRISKRSVLTRNSAAIETLGAATVLCTDKTGTLTMNSMALSGIYAGNTIHPLTVDDGSLPSTFHETLRYAALASQPLAFDPIEKELNKKSALFLSVDPHKEGLTIVKEYPLTRALLAQSHVWRTPSGEILIATKGAPEAIIELCHLDPDEEARLQKAVRDMSNEGLRVLGVGKATWSGELPEDQHDISFEFVGMVGFIDPVRESVPAAVNEAKDAGMRVIMITGDHPGTAQFLARKIGIENPEAFITGDELAQMSEDERRKRIRSVNIFARVVPEQKMLLVNALKANNEIVAMTGDGVNDAPALKSAHIGIAMGQRGTDVAREASSLVLLNDDFSSIVAAVRLGRRIYDNIKRAMGYVIAVHVPIAGMSVIPVLLDMPAVLLPVHIAFLELIIDPACSTVFESQKEDDDIMKRPPRNLTEPMFTKRTVLVSVIQGLGILLVSFALFYYAVHTGRTEDEARAISFTTLVLASIMLIAVNLSWEKFALQSFRSHNKALHIMFGATLVMLIAILYVPFFADIFHLAPLGFRDILMVVTAAFASLFWFEIGKWVHRRHEHAPQAI